MDMKNTEAAKGTKMAKKQTYSSDNWGTPQHEEWMIRTLGGTKALHPVGCKCADCKRSVKWAKGYQSYIQRVDR